MAEPSGDGTDELLLPPSRSFLATGPVVGLVGLGVGAALIVQWVAALFGSTHPGLLATGLGAVLSWWLIPYLIESIRLLRSPRLRLTPEGFEVCGHQVRWAEVAGFTTTGFVDTGPTWLRILPRPDSALAKTPSARLGALGIRSTPAFIPLHAFRTGDTSLDDLFDQWWKRHRAQ